MNNPEDGVIIYEDGKRIGTWDHPQSGYGEIKIIYQNGHVLDVVRSDRTRVGRD